MLMGDRFFDAGTGWLARAADLRRQAQINALPTSFLRGRKTTAAGRKPITLATTPDKYAMIDDRRKWHDDKIRAR